MQSIHVHSGRPFVWLAPILAAVALLAVLACQSSAETEPTAQDTNAPSGTPASEPENTEPNTVEINLPIAGRATTATRDDLRVTQGDTVRLTFTSDELGEIHLHGYDLTADVSPEQPGELVFQAENAGAFGINFHVFASDATLDHGHSNEHDHGDSTPETLVSDTPVGVSITAEVDAEGGVDVAIEPDGLRFAPELVDQGHTPGKGHAHIYVDGEKLGRVFERTYRIDDLPPGQHEIRVSLNTNDHRELVYDGQIVEDSLTVTVPDVGQATASDDHDHDHGSSDSHEGHDHGDEREIVAEVHLGNLEVYP